MSRPYRPDAPTPYTYDPAARQLTSLNFNAFVEHPLPWSVSGSTVYDRHNRAVFDMPFAYLGKWPLVAQAILARLNPEAEDGADDEPADEPIADAAPEEAADLGCEVL